jgi:hypothetical protein
MNSFAQWDFEQSDDQHGLVDIEAENYSSIATGRPGEDWTLFEDETCSNGAAMMAPLDAGAHTEIDSVPVRSPKLSYTIKFIRTGKHYIWARARREDGGSDSYHAGFNGILTEDGMMLTFHNSGVGNGEFGWINYRNNIEPASLDVAAGVNTLNIYMREKQFKIDKIILTTSDTNSYKPDSLGPAETLPPNGLRSISSNFDENLFTLSSSIVNEELIVYISEKEYLQGKLEIIDLQGKVLRSESIDNNSQLTMNVASLQSGMYLVRVQLADNSMMVKKFIKN